MKRDRNNRPICDGCGALLAAIWSPHRIGEPQQPPKYHCIISHCEKFNQEVVE